ncbi:MAG TPA: LysM peptidoglycan-binding domain-containing protein [Phenylobacterium sp.]|uniref:LysM peptidoglycan-binding domain-containing protein n=1 Tax=Phenylobacterium sp. TaxID=1871053 RepID=UPI002C84E141|nr:LysM peptidoglycan-binding domain-containing protein [Phenylobacterium sp.]HSV02094.1 LysM peptidoglycan-binding domain-containing protein [Phenylobacterium sp.]
MTQILARSVLALFASTALCASALPAQAARHHHRHHAAVHRSAHHHRTAAASAGADQGETGGRGASGRVIEIASPAATYTVKKGDSLQKAADQLDVDVAELKRLNHIRGSMIRAGQVLKGPGETAHAYVARSGDTLAGIAQRFGVSETQIRAENGFTRHPRIRAGQQVRLPEGFHDRGASEAEAARPTRAHSRLSPAEVREEAADDGRATRSVTGRVVDVAGGGRTYRVRKGDTLEKIADKLDVDVADLKKANHLRRNLLHPGQLLKAPGGEPAKAYVVGPGDTIYAISRRFGVSVEALRSANGMGRVATIHTGERLRLPAGWRDRGPATATIRAPAASETSPSRRETAAPGETPPPTAPRPYIPSAPRPYAPPTTSNPTAVLPAPTTGPSDAQITELGRGKFLWPLRGDIVSDFGPKPTGQRNDGINIHAEAGAPVRAAAAGDVVYAGDQVPGFGNLVLIKHADGWVTAYAHLSRIEVKMQQKVIQGQEIGQAGQTGGLTEPQLHFEVRYAANPADRARPIDPKLVLPQ